MAKIFTHDQKKISLEASLDASSQAANTLDPSQGMKHAGLPVERFDHRNGLKSLQIHEAVSSLDGRIWCATPAGLACYDGVSVWMFDRKAGLSSHGLRTLAVHPNNTLWIGTDIGFEVLDITGLTPIILWSENIGTVNTLQLDITGGVIGTSQGLFYADGHQSAARASDPLLAHATITSVLINPDREIWIAGPTIGLIVLNPAGHHHPDVNFLDSIGRPTKLAHGRHGHVIIGGNQGLICADPTGAFLSSFQLENRVGAVLQDDEYIWVGSGNSLLRFKLGEDGLTLHDTVLKNVDARHLMADTFDNIWISSGDQALLRLSAMRKTFTDSLDRDIGSVMCVKRQEDQLYIGGSDGLLEGENPISLAGMSSWDVIEDKYGKVWIATNDGLYCKVNPHFTIPYRHAECDVIAAECRVLAVFNDSIYVGSIRGLAVLTSDGAEEVLGPDGESLGYVYSLHVGPKGRLWIATLGRGIFRINAEGISAVALSSMLNNSNAYAMAHDQAGFVYLAHDNIISKIDGEDGVTILVDADVAIAAWTLKFIEPDLLIAGTSNGLIIYDAHSGHVRHKISGNFDDVPWEFTTSRSLEISDGRQIHCGLGSGLRNVNLDDLVQVSQLPSATLAYTRWRGATPIEAKGEVRILPGRWDLEIGLKTCWYLDDCTMRTRLVGFTEDWTPNLPVGPVGFTSLPEGDYSLEVEITSPMAGRGPVMAVYIFSVKLDLDP